jgi:uncharacterized protein (DUF486 family)
MAVLLPTIVLLALSNVFMTFAWYGHLGELRHKPLMVAILASWGIAFFEYVIQVPANRIGFNGGFKLAQLKILQEVISLSVFVPLVVLYFREPVKWDYLWAALCILGAVFFIFRGRGEDPGDMKGIDPSTPARYSSGPHTHGDTKPHVGEPHAGDGTN